MDIRNVEKKKYLGWAIRIILGLLMLSFFLPMFSVSLWEFAVKITGIESTFGIDVMEVKIQGNILCGLLFLIPAVLLLCSFIIKRKRDVLDLNIIGAITNVVIFLVYRFKIAKLIEVSILTLDFRSGFYAGIILNIVIIVLAYIMKGYLDEADDFETPEKLNKKGYIFLGMYCLSVIAIILVIIF